MRRIAVAAAWIVAANGSPILAGQAPSGEPIVQIGVFGHRADGSVVGAAYDTEPALDARVYASGTLCQMGAGSRDAPAWAMHAWRFSGRVLSKTPEEAVVKLTWQRTLDSGDDLQLPEHVVQLTLRAGDRVSLDSVNGRPDSGCSAGMSFEARYMPRLSDTVPDGAAGGMLPGSRARGTDGTSAAGASVRTGAGGISAGGAAARGSLMQVDLWLVHGAPGRPDETVHQLVRAPGEGADYTFAPISIDTPRGPVVVQVSGSFGIANGLLTVMTNRSVKYPVQAARSAADLQGSGRTVHPMPASNDVLSFEMPPILESPGGAALPNQLSLRLRISR